MDGFPSLRWLDKTHRASILPAASDEALLRIVCDISGEDRENCADKPICAVHIHTFPTSLDQWRDHSRHAFVEELVSFR